MLLNVPTRPGRSLPEEKTEKGTGRFRMITTLLESQSTNAGAYAGTCSGTFLAFSFEYLGEQQP
jgi:hypothetical protein